MNPRCYWWCGPFPHRTRPARARNGDGAWPPLREVLLAVDALDGLEETIAVLSGTDTVRRLVASDSELAPGEAESQEQLEQAMKPRLPSS